jgi:hypothetical protein
VEIPNIAQGSLLNQSVSHPVNPHIYLITKYFFLNHASKVCESCGGLTADGFIGTKIGLELRPEAKGCPNLIL